MKERKILLTNKITDRDIFRSSLEESINLSVKLKTSSDIELVVQKLTNGIAEAAKAIAPISLMILFIAGYCDHLPV